MSRTAPSAAARSGGVVPRLELRRVSRSFPGVKAVDAVDFDLAAGEVHVLFGENGAGKSTLINMVAGALTPDEGEIRIDGEPVELPSIHHARGLGISAVFQEFSLVPSLTVAQNLFLGDEPMRLGLIDVRRQAAEAARILGELGFALRPDRKVETLSRAEQQMVEIAKAFRGRLSVLILDEPTASLTERETARLFALIGQVKARGVGVIYITHRIGEIRRIGDRITVLRDGRKIATVPAAGTADRELVELMTGRVIEQFFPTIAARPAAEVLRVEGLTLANGTVRGASLVAQAGEVVGIAGLVGCGKSELVRACFGIETVATGRVWLGGVDVTGQPPAEMLRRGMFYCPPDRRAEGLILMRPVRENMSLSWLRLGGSVGRERALVDELAGQLDLRPRNLERAVEAFSGGNQQKALLGRGLTDRYRLYVLDEPTVGVDIATKVRIYGLIKQLCESGAAIVLVSSDLPEILHLAHRAYVMYRGTVTAELRRPEITEANVLHNFFERDAA